MSNINYTSVGKYIELEDGSVYRIEKYDPRDIFDTKLSDGAWYRSSELLLRDKPKKSVPTEQKEQESVDLNLWVNLVPKKEFVIFKKDIDITLTEEEVKVVIDEFKQYLD